MGLLQFGVFAIVVLCLAYLLIWVAGKLAPGHPVLIDNIIWVLAVLIILVTLARAVGFSDVPIPRLR